MGGVRHLTVAVEAGEQRLDRWLRRQFPALTQGQIEKLCRRGEIRVDGARVKGASRVEPGQVVRVPPLPAEAAAVPEEKGPADPPSAAEAETIRAAVIYRDDAILVLNKPPGLPVQGGSKTERHLGQLLPALRFGREDDPRLVHRLDKDTSGLLVLARTGAAAMALGKAFRGRSVQKTYAACVAGCPSPMAGRIRWALVKAGRPGEGEKMRLVPPDAVAETAGAVPAVTDYRVVEHAGRRAAWVALRPITGRTHQLRAHMAGLKTPIVGDGKYGGRGQENAGDGWGASLGGAVSRKLHLHAAALDLPHPATGAVLRVSAPLPEHMARSWALLGWDASAVGQDVFDHRGDY